MPLSPRPRLSSIVISLLVGAAAIIGCNKKSDTPTFAKISPADENILRDRIDAVVDHTLNNRTLNTHDHNAWQIVHGILPYGRAFRIDHDGEMIYALDWLLQGGALSGWDLRPGPNGVIAVLAPGSKAAQGHPDQWIGYLSQGGLDGIHGLSKDEPIMVQGKQYKMDDLLTQAEWDVYPSEEASWTIMAMTAWRPLDYSWTSSDGEKWTFERLVNMDAGQSVGIDASCGGTHRLYALSSAVNRYMKETGTPPDKLTGGWKKAYDEVQNCKLKAREYQQPDGNFSTGFATRPGSSPDVDTTLHATGHTLEWLSAALTDDEIQQPW
ncbi:MAG TPA: hypothetical protein VGI75_03315, partial [Pirellulales bacterium]